MAKWSVKPLCRSWPRLLWKRKQQDSDKDIRMAPILFMVEDCETKWELEDML